MNVAILTNGGIVDYEFYQGILKNYNFIICVDGGLNHAYKLKLEPDIIIGDFDSVSKDVFEYYKEKEFKILKYPKEKDYTDTEIAVKYAMDKKPAKIDILAGLGSRADHSIANIHLLKQMLDKKIPASIINENNKIILIDSNISLSGKPGDGISLLPFTSKVENVFTKGLAYEIINGNFDKGHPYGVSNYMLGNKARVEIEKGLLLVIRYKE